MAALAELKQDRTWLANITNALNQHRQKKNAAKKNLLADGWPGLYSLPVSMAARGYRIVQEKRESPE
jgi:hypothetical protein